MNKRKAPCFVSLSSSVAVFEQLLILFNKSGQDIFWFERSLIKGSDACLNPPGSMHDDSLSALGFIMIMSWKSFSFCSLLFSFGICPFSPGVVTESLRRVRTGSKNSGPLLLQTKTNFPICSINIFTLIDDSQKPTLCSCIQINSTGEGLMRSSDVCTVWMYKLSQWPHRPILSYSFFFVVREWEK